MNLMSHIVVLLIAWWLVFFTLLPVGVKTPDEAGENRVAGTPESAPVNPGLLWKVIGAGAGALIIWGLFYLVESSGWISLGLEAV